MLFCITNITMSQKYFDGKFNIISDTVNGNSYTLYDFSRKNGTIKAKYFATNACEQYESWKAGKTVLLITAAAYSDGWLADSKPVGLCVDNGVTITKTADEIMDGLVIVFNGGRVQGGIAVVDLDVNSVKCEDPFGSNNYVYYHPRHNVVDATNFLSWASREGLSVFQTQLVYSEDKSLEENFINLTYGNKRERRFLALCKKDNVVHHVVINAPTSQYLMQSAKNAKTVLERNGFNLMYMLNFETESGNLLYAYDGSSLIDLKPSSHEQAKIENAVTLLIYYKD